jgi:hypothetical protein
MVWFSAMKRSKAAVAFGIADLVAASLYIYLFTAVVPSRSGTFTAVAVLISLLLAAGGVAMFFQPARWARRLAAISAGVLLAACIALILLLLSSAAYLHGIYDGIGQAGAAIGLLAAALAIEVVGLLPALQLAHLWRTSRAGRGHG